MFVTGTDGGKLTIRAITFQNAQVSQGAGLYIDAAAVDVKLCVFINCQASDTYFGGGGIFVTSFDGASSLNVYGTSFYNNVGNSGGDIYNYFATITVHDTCPIPYSSVIAVEGK
jgi:hypothetical protein